MPENTLDVMRADVRRIFEAAVEAVDPYAAVRSHCTLDQGRLSVRSAAGTPFTLDLGRFRRIFLVGGGKATAPMAKAMEDLFGDRITRGTIVVKYGFAEALRATRIIEADHPVPDRNGVEGARAILDLLHEAGEDDLVVSLISGGGSALLPQPAEGIRIEEKQRITRGLLACGASIDEINAVRKHISVLKGGQMARAAYPAATLNLMLSDVVGDRIDVIASGPFTPDPSTFGEVAAILEKYALEDIPDSIRRHLQAGAEGRISETPKPGDPVFERVRHVIVGSNILALEAAEKEAKALGYGTLILSSMVEGETRDIARMHAAIAKECLRSGHPARPPLCVVSGGETTVTIRGNGLGGRNQEFSLAAALDLEGEPPRVVILSGGTDGNDGPTDAAGAVVDPLTVSRGRTAGLDAVRALRENDAYPYFQKTGDLLMTGPTRTNVMDVRLILVR